MKSARSSKARHNALVEASVDQFPQQILTTLKGWPKKNPFKHEHFDQIVVCGMGGSALAADWLRFTFWQSLQVPMVIVNNYDLPRFVTKKSLVIIASYSGTTEESISCLQQARARHLKQFVLTAGGILAETAAQYQIPHMVFDTQHNPSGQPRLGLGYFVAGYFQLAHWTGALSLAPTELIKAARKIQHHPSAIKQQTKQLAGQHCLIMASEHLLGAAHICSNQLNETAKLFAAYFSLPEANHHLIEGLSKIGASSKKWSVILLESSDYHHQTKKRYLITSSILKKLGFKVIRQTFSGSRLDQSLAAVAWSSALTLSLAEYQRLDAMAIPWVSYLKRHLGH